MKARSFIIYAAGFILLNTSCKKETTFMYEVEPVTLGQSGAVKNNIKSTTEFISIAYTDVFGSNISSSYLQTLNVVYTAFGDKKLMEDRIIRSFLNNPAANIPSSVSVNGDTSLFVVNTYKKIYNREPNEFEKYYSVLLIRDDPNMNARVVYYALMTSDEYRYY